LLVRSAPAARFVVLPFLAALAFLAALRFAGFFASTGAAFSVSLVTLDNNLVLVFCKTKKLRRIWFPAEPSVANSRGAERRAGSKGAPACGAA